MLVENARMVDLLCRTSAALELLDSYGVGVLAIRLEGSTPLIRIEDPAEKLAAFAPVTRTHGNGVGDRETLQTLDFEGSRLQWRAHR